MLTAAPALTSSAQALTQALGAAVRAQRKGLRVSATALAEAAGVSRVTVYRIEKGEPSVTLGAYANVLTALGLGLKALPESADATSAAPLGWLPARVRDLGRAIDRLAERTGWLERCMQAMAIRVPKALLWQRIRALRRVL